MDHGRTAGLVFAEEIVHQIDALPGEFGVQRDAQVGLLGFLDLVNLIGSQKIAATLRSEHHSQQQNTSQQFHLRLPSIRPTSSSSCTCCTFFFVASSIGRSSKLISLWNASSLRTRSRVAISAALKYFGLFRDRKSTRLNSSHSQISYAVFCLKKKT